MNKKLQYTIASFKYLFQFELQTYIHLSYI